MEKWLVGLGFSTPTTLICIKDGWMGSDQDDRVGGLEFASPQRHTKIATIYMGPPILRSCTRNTNPQKAGL